MRFQSHGENKGEMVHDHSTGSGRPAKRRIDTRALISEAIEAALLDHDIDADPKLIRELTTDLTAIAEIMSAQTLARTLDILGSTETSLAITRVLLRDKSSLKHAARVHGMNVGSLSRATKRLHRLLEKKCNPPVVETKRE